MILDTDKKILLKKKLEENRQKIMNIEIEKQKKQIIDNIDDFSKKYRFADEAETERIEKFISNLEFSFPCHINLKEYNISQLFN